MFRRFITLGAVLAYLWPASGGALVAHLSAHRHAAIASTRVVERDAGGGQADHHDSTACWLCAQLGVFKHAGGVPTPAVVVTAAAVCWSQAVPLRCDVPAGVGAEPISPRAPPLVSA